MANEEDYNEQVERELYEEEFMERNWQEMLDEESEWFIPSPDLRCQAADEAAAQPNGLSLGDDLAISAAPTQLKKNGRYRAWHDSTELQVGEHPHRIGVGLDYDAGLL
ncbi:unnamed protein product [Lampetra planeri]